MKDNFDQHKWFKKQYLKESMSNDRMGIFDDIDRDIEGHGGEEKIEYLEDVIKYCQTQISGIKSGTL